MRLHHPGGRTIHLAYCTNVHPAEDLPGVLAQLDRFALPVRERLGADRLGLGLWLAAPVAAALAEDRGLRTRLRGELTARGLEVVTLNGFPYRAFHAPVVKRRVYRPDWTSRSRLEYTLDLAAVLRDLLPDDAERGSISTLPFGWREPWGRGHADRARALFGELAAALRRDGRVRVALEPEPGCVVETADQLLDELAALDDEQIGACLDLAHLACAWEDPADVVKRLDAAGIPIVKAQVSAALEVADPENDAAALAAYAEPRFLHQTRSADGRSFDDLPEALASNAPGPWRVHFHLPLHAAPLPPLRTTTETLRRGLSALMDEPSCDHLEVETYTWNALPEAGRPRDEAGLVTGIAAEVDYVRDQLHTLGVS